MRTASLLLAVLALACAAATANCEQFVEYDDSRDLPVEDDWDIARGYDSFTHGARRLLVSKPTVTVGYSATAQFKVPVGSKDALPILQKALDQVKTNGGGVLLIGQGTFILKGQLFIKSNYTKVQGAGQSKTTLQLAANAPKWAKIGLISGYQLVGITISSLKLDGNKKNQPQTDDQSYGRYGIYISPNDNLVINRVSVVNFQRYGIDPPARNVKSGVDYSSSKKLTITVTNCEASYNNYDGFIFDTVIGVYVVNNTAVGNGRYGLQLCTGSWNGIVANNYMYSNGFGAKEPGWMYLGGNGCGMMADSNDLNGQKYITTNVVYRNNRVFNSSRGGFCTKGSKNVTVLNNDIRDAKQCIWFSATTGITVKNNKCLNTKSTIIDQGESTKVVTSGNVCGQPKVPCMVQKGR